MVIGIDLRFLENSTYSHFAQDLVKQLIHSNDEIQFNIYTKNPDLFTLDNSNFHLKYVNISCGSLAEQIKFNRLLQSDQNTVMIFFDHNKPLMYKWEYYTILSGLKDIFYQNFKNYFEKYKYLYLLEKNLKNSKKILCFDENTKDELIERFNISESHVSLLQPFFIQNSFTWEDNDIALDIHSKFQIWKKYLIYSGWDWIEKNIDRLIHVLHRLHKENNSLDLIFLGDKIGKNISLRHAIVENDLQKHVHFLDAIKPSEELMLYKQSCGVIFPSLYESFPFRLSNPLYLQIPILSSKLPNIEHIFGNSITYFSPISTSSILDVLKKFINQSNDVDYTNILEKYSTQNTAKQIINIIR